MTPQDISNGYIEIPVANLTGWDPSTNSSSWENLTLPPGSYYAALELYSGGNTYDIRILDDNTVAWVFTLFLRSFKSIFPSSSHLIKTTSIPAITALAGLVP